MKPQRMVERPYRDAIADLFAGFAGQQKVLTIPRPYLALCNNDHLAALLLSQCVYWTDRTRDEDGWFAKSYGDWFDELGMTPYECRRAAKALEAFGLERKLKRSNYYEGAATLHYRINKDVFSSRISEFVENGMSTNFTTGSEETSQRGSEETSQRIHRSTETTTYIDPHAASADADTAIASAKPSRKRKAKDADALTADVLNPVKDAVRDIWQHEGARMNLTALMLLGRATRKGYAEYNVTPGVTADELRAWAAWYKRHNNDLMIEKHDKVQSSILAWRRTQQAAPQPLPPAQPIAITDDSATDDHNRRVVEELKQRDALIEQLMAARQRRDGGEAW